MKTSYTAKASKLSGRNNYIITFRHPLRMDNGKPGRKVSKGLGTSDEKEAKKLESELNSLLANEIYHGIGARDAAAKNFDPRVVDIFFEGLDPLSNSHRLVRDRFLPLPKGASKEYLAWLLLGITGAGKSTLFRRLAGTEVEKFPATSVNRTTTFEIELVTGKENYRAVASFLTLHQTHEEIIESLSAAALKVLEGKQRREVSEELLDQSDQRFRLKYILGGHSEDDTGEDDFSFDIDAPTEINKAAQSPFVSSAIDQIFSIAENAKKEVEAVLGPLDLLQGEHRDYALDEMQNSATNSDEFHDLIGQIVSEISDRFNGHEGTFEKTSTGWPTAWTLSKSSSERQAFFAALKKLTGAAKTDWGTLLTPLVTGVRVEGPFRPSWVPEGESYNHVFIDTEGLLHSKSITEIPSQLTSRFKDVDSIILTESAKNALHSPVAGRVFEAIASTGFTPKFALLFTHMDSVTGDNLTTGELKRQHIFGGARNILENQVSKTVSRRAAEQLGEHLKENTFYFSYLDSEKYPSRDVEAVRVFEKRIGGMLGQMLTKVGRRSSPQTVGIKLPTYSFDALALAVQESSSEFIDIYEAHLGFRRRENITPARWQTIKAMSRRYAEGWFDGFRLHPVDTLLTVTRNVMARFLDNPLDWTGNPTPKEKTAVINRMQQLVNESLTELSKQRLVEQPKLEWQGAYGLKGGGSTFHRKQLVRGIFQHQVPIPLSISDRWAQQWVDEIKFTLGAALASLESEQTGKKS